MLTETKVGEALQSAGFDSSPLVDVIVLAAQLGAEQRDIDELDLNPVVVSDRWSDCHRRGDHAAGPAGPRRSDPPSRLIVGAVRAHSVTVRQRRSSK